jgi:hypothetical protein
MILPASVGAVSATLLAVLTLNTDSAVPAVSLIVIPYVFKNLILPDTNIDPVRVTPLPDISNNVVGALLPIPIRLPVTTRVLVLKVPATILSSLKTSNMGNPEISLTLINDPDKLSVIPNNDPELP